MKCLMVSEAYVKVQHWRGWNNISQTVLTMHFFKFMFNMQLFVATLKRWTHGRRSKNTISMTSCGAEL